LLRDEERHQGRAFKPENQIMEVISENSKVLIYIDEHRKFLVKPRMKRKLETDRGIIDLENIIGKKYGDYVETTLGVKAYLLKPMLSDFIEKFRRVTQVIYPKDLAFIVFKSGVSSGSIVVEAGTGSGVLTATLAYYVKPSGRVYTYEVRKEFIAIARSNIKMAGLENYVIFKNKNIESGIDEKNVDAVFYDLPTPWKLIDVAYDALKKSGVLAIFIPTMEQLLKTISALREHKGFINIEAYDTMLRRYKTIPGEVRPMTWAVSHTGYMVFARKILI